MRKQNWGEDRVMFFDAHGQLRSLPAAWTDVDPPDARTDAAAGRSFFRADDLSTLVALVGVIVLFRQIDTLLPNFPLEINRLC